MLSDSVESLSSRDSGHATLHFHVATPTRRDSSSSTPQQVVKSHAASRLKLRGYPIFSGIPEILIVGINAHSHAKRSPRCPKLRKVRLILVGLWDDNLWKSGDYDGEGAVASSLRPGEDGQGRRLMEGGRKNNI
jgi:hypothetical protein